MWLAFHFVAPVYRNGLAAGVGTIYEARGRPFGFRIYGSQLVFRSYARPTFEADLSTEGVDANTVFLMALFLSTPGMSPRNRLGRTALALVLLYLSHLLFLVTKVEVALIVANHPMAGSGLFWNAADNFFEITGKSVFPVVSWLLLCLPYMLGDIDLRSPKVETIKPPGRNDPCACGSGKKYKYCCGR